MGVKTSYLLRPALKLFCPAPECLGLRNFDAESKEERVSGNCSFVLVYKCRDCRQSIKLFAVVVTPLAVGQATGVITKIGELPLFGVQVTSDLLALTGSDRDLFIKGRRSENQGLGIGALTYYRRVIDDRRLKLFGELAKAAARLGDTGLVPALQKAAEENAALKEVNPAVPERLLIKGENPLTLLYRATSEGIHALSDEECLERASDIRLVLSELSDRLAQILKDHKELDRAVERLRERRDKKTQGGA